ncbi:MAG: methyltransferase domain-containing protein [Steroidobacteraceae bacterium]|jgi:phosphoethanolamine N-methyltransferase
MNPPESVKIGQPSEPGEYDEGMLALLQIIWGDGFLSPGGADELARILAGSDIAGCRILDIGCGLGAIDELLVTHYGAASVVGIDIDPALLEGMKTRIERANLGARIRGVKVEPGPLPFAAAGFDVVFSKDSLVQIPDKPAIFAEILRVLRPGGRFIAGDWLRGGTGEYSPEMMEYFRLEGIAYNMATLEQSAAALRDAGFVDVEVNDRHAWYSALARRELEAMEQTLKPTILARIGAARTQHFLDNWRQLVVVLDRGELRPGHLKATKPLD